MIRSDSTVMYHPTPITKIQEFGMSVLTANPEMGTMAVFLKTQMRVEYLIRVRKDW